MNDKPIARISSFATQSPEEFLLHTHEAKAVQIHHRIKRGKRRIKWTPDRPSKDYIFVGIP